MRSLALCRLWQLINSTDILKKERMLKTSRIDIVLMVRKRLPYIQYSCGTWGIESAAWVNEVGAVNEFPEARNPRVLKVSFRRLAFAYGSLTWQENPYLSNSYSYRKKACDPTHHHEHQNTNGKGAVYSIHLSNSPSWLGGIPKLSWKNDSS